MRYMLVCLLAVAWAGAQVDSLWYDNGIEGWSCCDPPKQGVYFDLDDFGIGSFEITQVHLTVHRPGQDWYVFFSIRTGDSLSPDSTLAYVEFEVDHEGEEYQELVWELEEPLMMDDIFWVVQEDVQYCDGAGLIYDTDGPSGHSMWYVPEDEEWQPFPSGDFIVRCYSGDMALNPTTWGAIKAQSQ